LGVFGEEEAFEDGLKLVSKFLFLMQFLFNSKIEVLALFRN
jgi:hypothetical protein